MFSCGTHLFLDVLFATTVISFVPHAIVSNIRNSTSNE